MSSGRYRETPEPLTGQGFRAFLLPASAEAGPGSVLLMLVGELDLVTADDARKAIRDAQDQTPALTCDLGDVWFIDLSGLRVLVDATTHARRTGTRLTVTNCPPIVHRMLTILSLDDALHFQDPPPMRATRSARLRTDLI
jgi:anti-sigma B factor antagonist